jgi:hypothetical protein
MLIAGTANLSVDDFDILRWDGKELVATSSNICTMDTLRADFVKKRITLSSADKGETNDPLCKGSDKLGTATLLGADDIFPKPSKPKK